MKPIAVRSQQPPEEKLAHSEETSLFFVRHSINSCCLVSLGTFRLEKIQLQILLTVFFGCHFVADPTPYKLIQQTPKLYDYGQQLHSLSLSPSTLPSHSRLALIPQIFFNRICRRIAYHCIKIGEMPNIHTKPYNIHTHTLTLGFLKLPRYCFSTSYLSNTATV